MHRSSSLSRRFSLVAAVCFALFLSFWPHTTAAQSCVGDCDAGSSVTVDELVSMVNIALGSRPLTICMAGDGNNDGQVTVDEIVTAVGNALNGCPVVTAPPRTATSTPTITLTSTPTRTPTTTPSATPTNTPTPDLEIDVAVNPDPAVAGEALRVTLTVTNLGAFAAPNLVVHAFVPPQVDSFQVATASSAATCNSIGGLGTCDRNETIIWNIGTLQAGNGITLSFPPVVSAGIAAGTPITFNVDVASGNTQFAAAFASIDVASSLPLKLALTEDREPVAAGAELTYTLAFGHTATAAVSPNATLSMDVPAGTTFVAASDGGELVNDTTVEWSIGTLQPGQGGERTLTVSVDGNLRDGTLIDAEAVIHDNSVNFARASTVTRVQFDQPLLLLMEVNADPAASGETLQVALTASNTNDVDLSGVVVTLRMPIGVDPLSVATVSGGALCNTFGGLGTCDPPEIVVWNIGTLAAGNGVTLTLPPTVRASMAAGSLIVFEAAVNDGAGRRAESVRSIVVEAMPALELALTEDEQPVAPGNNLTYSLTYGHVATAANAPNTTLRMPIPEGTSFVAASNGGSLANGVVEWPLGTLQPGFSGQHALTVQVSSNLPEGALIEAHALITDTSAKPNQRRAEAVTRVQTDLPLELSLEVNPDPVAPSGTLRVAVSAANRRNFDMTGVVVTLRMPVELNAVSTAVSSGAVCNAFGGLGTCDAPELIVWNVGDLEAGNGITLTLPPSARTNLVNGTTITFDATASDSANRRAAASRAIAVQSAPALDLVLTEDREPVAHDEEIIYTLAFGHVATAAVAPDTKLRMTIPPGTSLVGVSDGGAVVDNVAEWPLGTLQPGQSGKRTLSVLVDSDKDDGSLIEAHASITATSATPIQSRALAVTRVEADLPLHLAMEVNPDPASTDAILRIAVTATNTTAFDMPGVVVTLRMPVELDAFTAVTASDGAVCNAFGGLSSCDATELIVWNVGTIGAGNGVTLTLPPQVAMALPNGTAIVLEAAARDAENRRAAVRRSLLVRPAPPLELALTEEGEPAAPGGTLTYTLAFGHIATAATAPDTVLSMPVPAGTTFVSADGGTLNEDGVVEWSLGTLQPGDSGERTLKVTVSAGFEDGEVIEAQAWIADTSAIPNQSRASAVTRLRAQQPLLLSLEVNPDPATRSETLQVALTVTNTSAFALTGVAATLRMPIELNPVTAVLASGGAVCNTFGGLSSCDATELIRWNIGPLAAGSGVTLTLPPSVRADLPIGSTVVLEASISDDDGDRAAARRSIVVDTARALELAVADDGAPVAANGEITYSLAFGNTGGGAAPDTILAMSIPVGTHFVAASDAGVQAGSEVEWLLGTLSAGQSGRRTMTVGVDSDVLDGSLIEAHASISDGNADHSRTAVDTRVQAVSPIDVTMQISPDTVAANGSLVVMVTATNNTAFPLTGVVVTLRMPPEINNLAAATTSGGLCNAFAGLSTCDPPELIVWNVGTIDGSGQATFTLPPAVRTAIPSGTTIQFDAAAITGDKANSSARRIVIVQ